MRKYRCPANFKIKIQLLYGEKIQIILWWENIIYLHFEQHLPLQWIFVIRPNWNFIWSTCYIQDGLVAWVDLSSEFVLYGHRRTFPLYLLSDNCFHSTTINILETTVATKNLHIISHVREVTEPSTYAHNTMQKHN